MADPAGRRWRRGRRVKRLMLSMKTFLELRHNDMEEKERKVFVAAMDVVRRMEDEDLSMRPDVSDDAMVPRTVGEAAGAIQSSLRDAAPVAGAAPDGALAKTQKGNRVVSRPARVLVVGVEKDPWEVLGQQEHPILVDKARKAFKQLESGNVSQSILADAFGWPSTGQDPKCKKEMDEKGITNALAEYVFGGRVHDFTYVLNNLQDRAAFNFAVAIRNAVFLGTRPDDVKTVDVPVHLAKALLAFFSGVQVNWASVAWKLCKKRKEKCVFQPMWIPLLFKAWKDKNASKSFQNPDWVMDLLHLRPSQRPISEHAPVEKRRAMDAGGHVPKGWADAGPDATIADVIRAFPRTKQVTTSFLLCS